MPSPWAAFTSAPSRRSVRTASMSPRAAASATGASIAVAAHSVVAPNATRTLARRPAFPNFFNMDLSSDPSSGSVLRDRRE